MKKRIFLTAVVLSGIFLMAFLRTPSAEAASDPHLYVAKNEAAGLMGDVDLFAGSTGSFTLYLPGSAKTDHLYLSWDNSVTVENSRASV